MRIRVRERANVGSLFQIRKPPFISNGRTSLGQTASLPIVPSTPTGSLEAFFEAVDNAYNRSYDAIKAAKDGNVEVAKAFMNDPKTGGRLWRDYANEELRTMIARGIITRPRAGELGFDFMKPLAEATGQAGAAIIRGGDTLVRLYDKFTSFAFEFIAKFKSLAGDEWAKAIRFYQSLLDLEKGSKETIARLSSLQPSLTVQNQIKNLVESQKKLESIRRSVELKALSLGIPIEALKSDTVKFEGLGAWPVLAATAFTIGGFAVSWGMIYAFSIAMIGTANAAVIFTVVGGRGYLPEWMRTEASIRKEIEQDEVLRLDISLELQKKYGLSKEEVEKGIKEGKIDSKTGAVLLKRLEVLEEQENATKSYTKKIRSRSKQWAEDYKIDLPPETYEAALGEEPTNWAAFALVGIIAIPVIISYFVGRNKETAGA